MKRFTVRKISFVYRNSMLAGNPICKSFKMTVIVDRQWQNGCKGLSFRGYEWSTRRVTGSSEFRAAFKDDAKAKEICKQMNELNEKYGAPTNIYFNADNAWDWFDKELEVIGFMK